MQISSWLLNHEQPLSYYYCSANNKEYILSGTKNGYIFDGSNSYTIGDIILSIITNKDKLITIIEKYINIINTAKYSDDELKNQYIVLKKLREMQKEIFNLNINIRNYIDFSTQISNKFIEKLTELNIKKEKYNANNKNILELKEILNIDMFPESKTVLDDMIEQNNWIKEDITLIEKLSFKDFTLEYLNDFLLEFGCAFFNFILYFCDKKYLDIKYGNKNLSSYTTTEIGKLLQSNYNNFSTNKSTAWTKMAIICNDKIYLEDFENSNNCSLQNIKMLHFFEFDTLIDLFNLSLINAIDKKIIIKMCKNCGVFFIPESRTDEKYCNNPSPQNPNKTCKEYGAKKTYREEIKSNPIKSEHNRTSQFYRMKIKRCSNEKEKEKLTITFDKYKAEFKNKKKKYDDKKITESAFVKWIISQKDIE